MKRENGEQAQKWAEDLQQNSPRDKQEHACACCRHRHEVKDDARPHAHEHGHPCGEEHGSHIHEEARHSHAHRHAQRIEAEGGCFVLDAYDHDGASVASVSCALRCACVERVRRTLEEQMKEVAAWIDERGGVVGHIKAGLKTEEVTMLSITDAELQKKSETTTALTVNFAAIALGVPVDALRERVEELFRAVCRANSGGDA